jgi:hypothetical protein
MRDVLLAEEKQGMGDAIGQHHWPGSAAFSAPGT